MAFSFKLLIFSSQMKIIADSSIPFAADCFSSIGQVQLIPGREMSSADIRDADILVVRTITAVDEHLLAGSKVRFVGTVTIGFDHLDTDFLRRHNIAFASAPGSNANSVAEYVIAALFNVAKKHNINLQNKSIGIIGVGNCGSRVAKKTEALGMKLCLNDPPLYRKTQDPKYLPLENLFDCDFITLHTPLNSTGIDKTFHLADDKFFNSVKNGCIFLNTSRGPVVETEALKYAIRSGKLAAAVLDVWENEPNIDVELLEMADIATPHIAGYSLDGKVTGLIMVYQKICEHFGLEAKFDRGSFLPAPAVGCLEINPTTASEQDILRQAVEKIYDINTDDLRNNGILKMPAEKRPALFDHMRDNYFTCREFQHTQIALKPYSHAVARKLEGIGFTLANTKNNCGDKK